MKFTHEDFFTYREEFTQPNGDVLVYEGGMTTLIQLKEAARLANAKLQEWLEKAPLVYGSVTETDPVGSLWGRQSAQSDRHKARLVYIEEISR